MKNPAHITGLPGEPEPSVSLGGSRPLSMEWISDNLLQATLAIWSPHYEHSLSPDEAVETLMNVKRFAEALMGNEGRDNG